MDAPEQTGFSLVPWCVNHLISLLIKHLPHHSRQELGSLASPHSFLQVCDFSILDSFSWHSKNSVNVIKDLTALSSSITSGPQVIYSYCPDRE